MMHMSSTGYLKQKKRRMNNYSGYGNMVTFNIIDGEYKVLDRETIQQEYLRGVPVYKIRGKHNLSRSDWYRILREFKSEGVPLRGSNPKYYYWNGRYWVVCRYIKRREHRFGLYHTREEAEMRVRELESNNWDGLL